MVGANRRLKVCTVTMALCAIGLVVRFIGAVKALPLSVTASKVAEPKAQADRASAVTVSADF